MKKAGIFISLLIVAAVIFVVAFQSPARSDAPSVNKIATSYSVSVVNVSTKTLTDKLTLVGTIVANNDVVVISETQGRVVKVNAEIGDYVSAGTVLVEVDAEMKQAAYKTAQMTYEKAKKDLDRFETLYKEGSIPETQIEQVRWNYQSAESQYIIARKQYNDTKITSPISGVVSARFVNLGSMVMGAPQSTPIANVVDISKMKVKVNVPENDVFRMKVGNKVEVTTDVFPTLVLNGTISSISVKGDEAHTYPVEVTLTNPQRQLKSGMFGTVTFTRQTNGSALVIPRESIVGSMKEAKVFVVDKNTAKLRSVVVGAEIGTDVEIVSGLASGETVVVNGQNNLRDNASVIVRK